MSQITLRDIPSDMENFLRSIAQKKGQSINKTILEFLCKGLGISEHGKKKRDLSALAGTWNEQDLVEFEENTKFFEEIDNEMWKK